MRGSSMRRLLPNEARSRRGQDWPRTPGTARTRRLRSRSPSKTVGLSHPQNGHGFSSSIPHNLGPKSSFVKVRRKIKRPPGEGRPDTTPQKSVSNLLVGSVAGIHGAPPFRFVARVRPVVRPSSSQGWRLRAGVETSSGLTDRLGALPFGPRLIAGISPCPFRRVHLRAAATASLQSSKIECRRATRHDLGTFRAALPERLGAPFRKQYGSGFPNRQGVAKRKWYPDGMKLQGKKIILLAAAKILDGLGQPELASKLRAVDVPEYDGYPFKYVAIGSDWKRAKVTKDLAYFDPDADVFMFIDGTSVVRPSDRDQIYMVLPDFRVTLTKRRKEITVTEASLDLTA